MKEKSIYTIGHSTHTADHFLSMLRSFEIETLADIRSFPGSRRYPHFNKDALKEYLESQQINYVHFKDLGGRRNPLPDSHNTAWRLPAFRGYADYMETTAFQNAAAELGTVAATTR